MARTRTERIDQWRDHVDELCHDGETVRHRADLEGATIAVTNQRVLAFTPHRDEPKFRHVDRPDVGTVSVETDTPLRQLCLGGLTAVVGVGLLELARGSDFATAAPTVDLEGIRSMPGGTQLTRVVEATLEAIETALAVLEGGVLLLGVAALVVATVFVAAVLRSRSRRLVIRVSGGTDIEVPVSDAAVAAGTVEDLERAIRPGSGTGSAPALEERRDDEGGRPTGENIGAEESG
ncbi:hypothetical protein [Natrinema salsiterrestre]|uniref:Uncharacterized protein n=1 Tax=Natrinema salsiterrestre TaxID=2950540 RepID=A0A9Q4L418_9EURY|nr:hypothetical protein [Natrinema salsiterrestre]MDF9747217.1 hypothetical protein [Natrinema salsiterrestre]